MRFFYVILFYSIIALIKIGDLIIECVSFLGNVSKKTRKAITRMYRKIRKDKRLMLSRLRIRYNTYHDSFSLASQQIHRNITLFIKKAHVKMKRRPRKKLTVIFPLPFRVKMKYFILGGVFSFCTLYLPLLIFLFLQELPNPKILTLRQLPQTTKILDRNGTLLYEIYASENRTVVPLADIPKYLQHATIAIEDKNFYSHPGFDLASIIRAIKETVTENNLQGGSTITQQLVRSSILTPEQSIMRKIKEIILAYWAERMYSKQQILAMYFNHIPYGGTAWGAQAAAEVYFGKQVKDLTLAESAFLAGITAAPTHYSPYGQNPTLWKTRQKEVLQRMVALGFISQTEANEADQQALVFRSQQTPIHAPHFVMFVKDLLIQKYGLATVERGGLTITTSLDLPTQKMTETAVAQEVQKAAPLQVTNGAAVIVDPKTGDILAMVGSKNFSDTNGGNVNIATALRQPGSAIKVVTYAAALTNGFTAATILDDSPVTYQTAGSEPYKPVNYNGQFFGRMPLRLALANSLNIPAVKVLNQIGIPTMVKLGIQMGIKNWDESNQYGLAITLGSTEVSMLDMTTVYSTLANKGKLVDLNPLMKVTDSKNHTLFTKQPQHGKQIVAEGIAFILSHILADNNARLLVFGSNSPLVIPNHTVSVKTGTSDNKRDNWTVGYTNNYVVTTWVGNNDNSPMSQSLASGITGAAPIWNRIMTQLLAENPEQPLIPPSDIVMKPCLGRTEYFFKGTENNVSCFYPPTPTPNSPDKIGVQSGLVPTQSAPIAATQLGEKKHGLRRAFRF